MVEPTVEIRGLKPGTVYGDRYRIEGILGRGGMGEVWRAWDLKLCVDVALKRLHPGMVQDPKLIEMMRREVRTAREVASPHVCRVFDLVEIDGHEMVSMEYVDGSTLDDILVNRGPLDLKEAATVASQLLAGLEAIHEKGLVHRDLKPSNVMVTRAGRVVLMDFGIARGMTNQTHTVAGTPAYMAPEQMEGEDLDAQADVFSAGVVLAEMLSVEARDPVTSREKLLQGLRQETPRVPEGPWARALARAVAADRTRRPSTARELSRMLEDVTVGEHEDANPYPGLSFFTQDKARFFFGRELEVEEAWKKLRRVPMLAVIGPSGVGKSSFLRAGLLPSLPGGWQAVICTPGTSPFINLAQTLASELAGDAEAVRDLVRFEDPDIATAVFNRWRSRHEQALVILDQAEELFTLNPPETQANFAELLGRLTVEADIRVVVSMRDDFFFHCHRHPALTPLFSSAMPIAPLGGDDLRRALVQPAQLCGYRFEDEELIEEMLAPIVEERGALPLLAFAASRLWEKRDRTNGLLARRSFEEIGKVGGALAQHAERTLEAIGSERLEMIRELFRNLVTAEGTRVVRDRQELLSVFEDREGASEVLRRLVDARLLTSFEVPAGADAGDRDQPRHRVEIIHESLLTSWPRLVRWRTQDADSAQLRDQLRQAARLWEDKSRSDDVLWTGTAYREFELWRERYPGGLTDSEEDFARAMVDRNRRRRRRRRIVTGAAFAILLGFSIVVGVSRQQAVKQARHAEASRLIVLGQQSLQENNTASLAYALASLEIEDSAQGRLFALEALWKGPTEFLYLGAPGAWTVDFSPDGRWLAEGADNVNIWSEEGGEPVSLPAHRNGPVQIVSFHPEKPWLLSCSQDSTVRISSVPGGEAVHEFRFEGSTSAGWGPHGESLRTSTSEAEGSRLWRSWSLDTWESTTLGRAGEASESLSRLTDPRGVLQAALKDNEIRIMTLDAMDRNPEGMLLGRLQENVSAVTIDPRGEQLASIDKYGEIRLWSLGKGYQETSRLIGHHKTAFSLRFNRLGTFLASSGDDGMARVWDLSGPPEAEAMVLRKPGNQVNGVAFHPDGTWIAVSGAGYLRLWPLTRRYPVVLKGHTGPVFGMVFDPEGKWLASASSDRIVRTWSLSPGAGEVWSRELGNGPYEMNVGKQGKHLIVCGPPGVGATLMATADGETRVLDVCTEQGVMLACAISSDGRHAAASGSWGKTGAICVWDLGKDRSWVLDAGHGNTVMDLDFTADGRLVESSASGARLWNIQEGTDTLILEGNVYNSDVSADGQRIVIAGGVGVYIHDRRTGKSRKLETYPPQNLCAIDSSGEWIATSRGSDGEIRFGSVKGEEPHLLLRHDEIYTLAFDPLSRWIGSGGRDGSIKLWPIPSGRPFHTLPYQELMERLRSLTSLRMEEDPESETGYSEKLVETSGWAKAPSW